MMTLFYLFCLFYLSHCFVSNSRERKTSKTFHRKALTLEEKIILIKENRNGHGLSVRQLAAKYKVVVPIFFVELKNFQLIILLIVIKA